MQRGPCLDGKDGRMHDLFDGSRGQRCNCFSLRLNVLQKRQPPVTPRDPIGVAATQQIAFTDHSKQLQVRREHGNGAYALLEQQDRDIAHAAPSQNGNDILRHDLAGGVRSFDDSESASFVSHAVLSPRAESAAYSAKRAPCAWLRNVFMANAADRTAELSLARRRHGAAVRRSRIVRRWRQTRATACLELGSESTHPD